MYLTYTEAATADAQPGYETARLLLEGAARSVLSRPADPDRLRQVVYPVVAWVRLWPPGPGTAETQRLAESVRDLAERLAGGWSEATAERFRGACFELIGWLDRALRQAVRGEGV